jgi:hypothetical protein
VIFYCIFACEAHQRLTSPHDLWLKESLDATSQLQESLINGRTQNAALSICDSLILLAHKVLILSWM